MTSGIQQDVVKAIDENGGEIHGTETIAITVNARDKGWLVSILRRLASGGSITITPSRGGRGNKTVYKRNRNSPGTARKI